MARDLKLQVVLAAIDKATSPIKSIMQGSIGLARTLKSTRETLKGLQAQQNNISSFKTLKGATEQTAKAMQANRDKVKALSQQLANTANPTKALSAEFQRAARQGQALKQKHGEQQRELQGLRGKLNAAGISTRNLGQHERDLRAKITQTNQSLSQQEGRLKRVTQQQQRLAKAKQQYEKTQSLAGSMAGTGAAGLATGSGMLYAGARMMAPGVEYGAQMSELQAVTRLDKGDDRFTALKQQARDLGASTAFSATDVGAGQTFLARAGFTPEAINASMQDVLDLALANGVDLALTADIASNISSAFKIDPEVGGNITRVTDVLSGASARANVNLEMLGDTMKYMGSAEGLGLSLEQAATMAGLLGNIGIQGSQAGTTMRAMLNRLTAPAKSAQKSIAALSLQVSDASGNLRAMPDILQDVATATAKMGNIERAAHLKNIFGEEAGSGMAELISKQGTGALTQLLGELQNVQGENAKMAATRADNIDGDLKGLRSAWEEVGIGITDVNEGPLREAVQSITGVIRSVGQWIQANPELVAQIAKTAAGLGILIAAGGAIALTLASILGPIAMVRYGMALLTIKGGGLLGMLWSLGKTALPLVAKGIMFIGRALLMNPIGLAITAIAAAAYLIYTYWEPIKAFFGGLWAQIKTAFAGGIGAVAALLLNWSPLGLFYQAFAGVMSYFGVELPGKFSEFGGMLISGLVSGITNAMGSVKTAIVGAGESTVGWFKDKLGIHSPSRVFAELGGFTMAGLTQGLAGGEDGPLSQLGGFAKRMTQTGALALGVSGAAMPALAGGEPLSIDNRPPLSASAGAGVSIGGDTYQITIQAAPGGNAADLAQQISRMLDERERSKAARIRSRLHDQE